jgi:hypothetical protein
MSQRKVAQSRWLIALVLLTACAGCLGMLVARPGFRVVPDAVPGVEPVSCRRTVSVRMDR